MDSTGLPKAGPNRIGCGWGGKLNHYPPPRTIDRGGAQPYTSRSRLGPAERHSMSMSRSFRATAAQS